MSYINFPVLLLLTFLVLNLVVGVIKGRGVNTVKDFAVGNKNFGAKSLAMTLLATQIGGAAIYGTTNGLMSIGLVALTGIVFYIFSCIIRSFFITNQLDRFQNCISFGDFIYQLYGGSAKCLCGFLTGIYCIYNVALQIQFLGFILNDFFGLNLLYAIILSTLVISSYTSFGGMRSVVATDILQFIIIFLSLFFLIFFTLGRLGLSNNILSSFSNVSKHFFIKGSFTSEYFISRTAILLFLSNLSVAPCFQRLIMAKNRIIAKRMYLYTALTYTVFVLCLVVIIFSAVAILGNNFNTKSPLNYIIEKLVPKEIVPFIGLGLVAVIFSTADSFLHSAGLCLSKDFLEPIVKRSIKLSEVRFFTFLSGGLSMTIVLWLNGLFKITSIKYFEAPILVVPVLYGFLGFKTSNRMFWSSAVAGFLGAVISGNSETFKPFCVFIGCCASLITYFLVHVYENEGFNFIGKKIFYKSPISGLGKFQLPPKERLIINLEKSLNRNYNLYASFGIVFCLVAIFRYTILSHYTSPYSYDCFKLILVGFLLSLLLITIPMCPLKVRFLAPIFWYMVITYCLPFLVTVNLVLHGVSPIILNFSLMMVFSFFLLFETWQTSLFMLILGCSMAIITIKTMFAQPSIADLALLTPFLTKVVFWQLFFGGISGVIFVALRDHYEDNLKKNADYMNFFRERSNIAAIRLKERADRNSKDLMVDKKVRLDMLHEIKGLFHEGAEENYDKILDIAGDLEERIKAPKKQNIAYYLNPNLFDFEGLVEELYKAVEYVTFANVSVEVDIKLDKIRCDRIVISRALYKFAKEFLKYNVTDNEENDTVLTFSSTNIKYVGAVANIFDFEKRGISIVPALCITLTNRELAKFDDNPLKDCYIRKLDKFLTIEYSDVVMKNIMYGIFAHYGVVEFDIKKLIWQCVIPLDYFNVKDKIGVVKEKNTILL